MILKFSDRARNITAKGFSEFRFPDTLAPHAICSVTNTNLSKGN